MSPQFRLQALLRPEFSKLSAYQPETAPARILLDANENPYGPPQAYLEEAQALLPGLLLQRYPDPSASALRALAARVYGVEPGQIVFGNGSDDLVQLLMVAFGGSNRTCLVPTPTFSMFRLCALANGLVPLEEPLDDAFQLTPRFLERAESAMPALVFLAWPNNPTGTLFDRAAIVKLLELRQSVVVVDEAYAEFSGESFLPELARHPNLVVLRTLSKAYGLAGLRLGMLFASGELAAQLEKARLPYNLGVLPQALGALAFKYAAAFADSRRALLRDREELAAGLAGLPGMRVTPSRANFLLISTARAKDLHEHWLGQGIRVRSFFGDPRLGSCLRVTVGRPDENRALMEAAQHFFKGHA